MRVRCFSPAGLVFSPGKRERLAAIAAMLAVSSFAFACASFPPYRAPDRVDETFRRLGCLDVYVQPYEGVNRGGAQTFAFVFGNRCRAPVMVDVGGVSVLATVGDRQMTLVPADPRGEIHPATLDGLRSAREVIVFESTDVEAIWSRVCVHLDRVTPFEGEVDPVCVEPYEEVGDT